jgi:hypothetical protein
VRYLDDILITIGLLLLAAFVFVQYGAPYVLAYAGGVLLAVGVVVGLRTKGGPA